MNMEAELPKAQPEDETDDLELVDYMTMLAELEHR